MHKPQHNARRSTSRQQAAIALALLVAALLIAVFREGLAWTVEVWQDSEEYNHGFLIPIVAFYLLWLRADELGRVELRGSRLGLLVIVAGLAGLVLGDLSSIYIVAQYSFLLTLFGIVLAAIGWSGMKIVWVPLIYLVFMIPLPDFIQQRLSGQLQLLSSEWGVAVIRAFGISVFVEGNVIDLGVYQLQVAEACSGLRYLFPLLSFGFLCAAIFRAPWWQRTIIFLSAIPLTVLMNSFRIGVIGVLVDSYGIEQAEGFLHYFEGWVVFMTCVAFLFLEMWVFSRMAGEPLMSLFELDVPTVDGLRNLLPRTVTPEVISMSLVLLAGLLITLGLQSRTDVVPDRTSLTAFPLRLGEWRGDTVSISKEELEAVAVDDYLSAIYRRPDDPAPVSIWIAYYDTQKQGKSVHSPQSCLPGGGWMIETFGQKAIPGVGADGEGLTVNRAIVSKGSGRQLVYYWFEQRGRRLASEYLVKWYIFWDALTRNRTDGALIRVITYVPDAAELPEAEQRLEQFVRDIDPLISYYLPQEAAPLQPMVGDQGSAGLR